MPTMDIIEQIKKSTNDEIVLQEIIEQIKRREQAKNLDRFFELSVDMISIAGMDGYFKQVSRSFEKVLGYSRDELLSRPIMDFVLEEDHSQTSLAINSLKENDHTVHFENRYRSKNGGVKWLAWKSVLAPEENLIYAVARDVTEQKHTEQKLREYNNCLQNYMEENLQGLRYAGKLQRAMMPEKSGFKTFFPESFIFYAPKQIVSGDFYWFETYNDKVYAVSADCTGHGVPGALLSVLGIDVLQHALVNEKITNPSFLLRKLDQAVNKMIGSKQNEIIMNDGMDISVCVIDMKKLSLEFAAVNNSIYLVRNRELIVIKAEKYQLGSYVPNKIVDSQIYNIQKGDVIYMFSDGFADQFGGSFGKKFGSKQFKDLLLSISSNDLGKNERLLDQTLEKWRGDLEQVDDILVMGFRI